MEEMNNQDTPQPQTANTTSIDAFGAPANEGSDNSNNLSVEDAFFSKAEVEPTQAPEEGQPADLYDLLVIDKKGKMSVDSRVAIFNKLDF